MITVAFSSNVNGVCHVGGDDDRDYRMQNQANFLRKSGLSDCALITPQQYGEPIRPAIVSAPVSNPDHRPIAEGLITQTPKLAIGVFSCDCMPVMLSNGETVAAIHVSRDYLRGEFLEASIQKVRDISQTDNTIEAYIGPCLTEESHEVDRDYIERFLDCREDAPSFFKKKFNKWKGMPYKYKYHFDFVGYVRQRLDKSGVDTIFESGIDSYSNPAYYSKRQLLRSGDTRSFLNLSLICINE